MKKDHESVTQEIIETKDNFEALKEQVEQLHSAIDILTIEKENLKETNVELHQISNEQTLKLDKALLVNVDNEVEKSDLLNEYEKTREVADSQMETIESFHRQVESLENKLSVISTERDGKLLFECVYIVYI